MQAPGSRIQYLVAAYLDNRATASEFDELMEWLRTGLGDEALAKALQDRLDKAGTNPAETQVDWDRMIRKVLQTPVTPVRRMLPWRKIAVAASILLVIGLGSYFLLFHRNTPVQEGLIAEKNDVRAPASNRATLTLDGGKVVYLDSAGNGLLAEQDKVTIIKQGDGQIFYEDANKAVANQSVYNTLYNPRGSKAIHLTLSDGTRVWLNAESSLRYPTAFTGEQRSVEITGEAYFEVTSLAMAGGKMPFVVKKGDVSVTVLGTRFNVNAYEDEKDIQVTLAEGSVNVMVGKPGDEVVQSGKLAPGQQAQISSTAPRHMTVKDKVDVEKFTAWKEDLFIFSGDDIQTIMRQLARWYNVQVEYRTQTGNQHFTGIISRNNNLSEVLKMLQATGKISFEIDKDKIAVSL